MTNRAYLFQLFGTEIFLFCVPEPTLSHGVWKHKRRKTPPRTRLSTVFLDPHSLAFLCSYEQKLRPQSSLLFSNKKGGGAFFTRAHTLQSSRAHRRGHKTRGSPAEEEEETDPRRPEDEDDDDDGGGGGDARHQGLED